MEIRAEKLEIAYGDYLAVKDMDVRVEKGKITTIIGPNGSGKSTVLKALTRLLNYRRGATYLDARSLRDFSAKELARHIGVRRRSTPRPRIFRSRSWSATDACPTRSGMSAATTRIRRSSTGP